MKYQKSMMKLMESVLLNRGENKSIAAAIKETHSGRSSSFNALRWLEANGFIKIQSLGNQKIIKPIIDNHTLRYKYYLDSLKFKTLSEFNKLIINVFASYLQNFSSIKSIMLLNPEEESAFDFLILAEQQENSEILKIKRQIETFFGITININFSLYNTENILRGINIYQSSFFAFKDQTRQNYLDFLEWAFAFLQNKDDKKFSAETYENALLSLSQCYGSLEGLSSMNKKEASLALQKKYHIKDFNDLKKGGIEIGKRIFK